MLLPTAFFMMNTERKYKFYWKWIEQPKRRLRALLFPKSGYATHALPRKMKKLRGHLAVDTFEVVRILGWTDQYEEDIYWVILTRRRGIGNVIELSSACGGYTPLYKKLKPFDYWHMVHLWDLNGATVEYGLQKCAEQNIKVL